jgi:hypothetical protein
MPAQSAASPARTAIFWAILILLLLAVMEGGSVIFLHFIGTSSAHFFVWDPDLAGAHKAWVDAHGNWDDELGWPSPHDAVSPPRDASGAKFNKEFPQPGHACASAYGDSFIWGYGIPLQDGWVERLSYKLGCRVANFGVDGYGTDQAYVRFTRMTQDEAPAVLLGVFPENVMRNVNQYRGFLGFPQSPVWLKGRFVLDSAGKLQWIHRPRIDEAGYLCLLSDPASVIPHEYLLPNSHDGPVTVGFPYTLALTRVLLMPRLWVRLTGQPSWADFFHADHPSGALALTAAIAEAFARDAERRGKRALVLMLPGASSFRARAKFGRPEYQPLLNALAARHIDVFDPAPALLAALGQRSYCDLYIFPARCDGHFGVFGNRIVADVMAAELRRRGLFK